MMRRTYASDGNRVTLSVDDGGSHGQDSGELCERHGEGSESSGKLLEWLSLNVCLQERVKPGEEEDVEGKDGLRGCSESRVK